MDDKYHDRKKMGAGSIPYHEVVVSLWVSTKSGNSTITVKLRLLKITAVLHYINVRIILIICSPHTTLSSAGSYYGGGGNYNNNNTG